MLEKFRSVKFCFSFDEEGKMVRVLKASEVDIDRSKLREHDRTLEYVLRNIFIWGHTQVEKELKLNDHTSKVAKFNSEYGHSGKSLYDYAYEDPCTADDKSQGFKNILYIYIYLLLHQFFHQTTCFVSYLKVSN